MADLIYKEESYTIIGTLFEVYNHLGHGFSEIVYKEAIEHEFKSKDIPFEREKEYRVNYKDIVLPHKFYADFVIFDKIILEIKCVESMLDTHIAQCINYLKVSGCRLALLANFHKDLPDHKRIIF